MTSTWEHVSKAVGVAAVVVATAAIALPASLIYVAGGAALAAGAWLAARPRPRVATTRRLKGYAGWDSVDLR